MNNAYEAAFQLISEKKPIKIFNGNGESRVFLPTGEAYTNEVISWFITWDKMRGNDVFAEAAMEG